MAKENFLLVSLEESQSKQLAEVLNNNTSRKIINYLSLHDESTESEIAKKLSIPLSTVHYNLQKLKQAHLVEVEHFTYSKKGREVDHYKLANKYVIIIPKKVKGIKSALRNILPVGLIILGIGAFLQFTLRMSSFTNVSSASRTVPAAALEATPEAAMMADTAIQTATHPTSVSYASHYALWFIIGAFSALTLIVILIVIFRLIRQRRSNI
jgi:DNA-binding transcriptional ArsR family regulator